ncbi:MAG: hypothetical protein A3F67_09865 [Verrucomicrobia bacterium RIFCSPHIGHO2_12_FULL_41_10]|nr:MAG: hypothetical protein A3F67_09865 [Verrucomicrobia bacterium RIFCSPHIGHO2_12_FULL_41_10]HLB34135.1 glycosyltransferase family 4 protein [Chthoniobacterales bacterium]
MSRILVLCYEYPPLGGGGGRVAAQVARALIERGHEVKVITGGMPHLPRRSIINGVEVIRVRSGRKREDTCSILEMIFWVLMAFPVALREAWHWRPQVMHAHFAVPTGFVAWMIHLLTRIPYVLTAHLGDVPGGVPEQTDRLFKIVKPFTIPIWRSAARVTAVSSFVSSLVQQAYGITPEVILNGIKLAENSSLQSSKHSEVPQLIMVGRLSVQKNPLFALQALALLRDLPWRLQIIGEGPLSLPLYSEVDRLELQDRITFSGWLSADEVVAVMQVADILLMPSLSEGLPMVGVEALAHGLAIIGSRIGGLADIVSEGENGQLFELSEGPQAMVEALRPFLEDREVLSQAQEASRKKAVAFEWSRSIDAYEKVLSREA